VQWCLQIAIAILITISHYYWQLLLVLITIKATDTMKNTDHYYPETLLESPERLDLKAFWHTIVRRKRLIILFVAVMFVLSLLITLLMNPVYRATTLLEIERKIASVTDSGLVNGDDPRDTRDFYQTQYELIKSRSVAKKVIEKLHLEKTMVSTGLIQQIKEVLKISSNNNKPDLERIFIENITIEPVNTSRLVRISYDAETPEMAAKIVNALAATFIERNQNKYNDSTKLAKKHLEEQLTSVKTQLQKADKYVSDFRIEHNIVIIDDGGEDTSTYRLKELTAQLVKAEQKKRSIATPLSSEQKKNPPLELKNAILEENSLREQIKQEKTLTLKTQGNLREFQRYQDSSKALQGTYDNLLQRLKQFNIAVSGNSRISIVDAAIAPSKKNSPKLLLNLLFGTLLGFLLGTAYAFLIEYLDDTINSADELERLTKLPNLAIIPNMEAHPKNEMGLLSYHEIHSYFAEAFRTFRTSIKFLPNSEQSKSIFITSANASEGKSTTASNLACIYAQSGRSVLLIDADLRNPSVHKIFQEEQDNGLSELLSGDAEPKDVIKTTEVADLYLITAGKFNHDPVGLISNLRMEKMLKLTSSKYDHVIIDGAPVLGLADALILSNLTSATIFVTQSGRTDKKTILSSINRLRQAQGNIIGTLMTKVDMDKSEYAYNYLDYNARSDADLQQGKLGSALDSLKKL
jgi:capsular exopolysaccharide synthesis family protein